MTQVLRQCMSPGANVVGPCALAARPALRTARLPALLIALGLSCSGTRFHRQQRSRRVVVVASAAADVDLSPAEEDDEDIGLGVSAEMDESELGPPPEVRYQQPMSVKDRKAWRAKAETMAKDKRLLKIQIGQLGITQSFLRACADILLKHGLVRVKLGDGCGLELRPAAAVLAKYLDCVCVSQVGFTLTLYRQAGLPRPSNLPSIETAGDAHAREEAEKVAAHAGQLARHRLAKKKAGQRTPQDRPPEFKVL